MPAYGTITHWKADSRWLDERLDEPMNRSLRPLLAEGRTTVVPGVGDALGAILAAEAGFSAIYMSGYYVSTMLGFLDVGLVSSTEMVNQAARICAAVDLPVLADADTGYGNAINVIRTVREFESAGVAGIHLEDQDLPKKCGHMDGLVLISEREMCAKIAAAVDARASSDFLVIARTDAISTDGLAEAIRRGCAYRHAGADAVMIMAPRSIDDLKRFRDGVEGPLVCTVGSWPFNVTAEELGNIGYQLALFTISTLRRTVVVVREVLAQLRRDGGLDHATSEMIPMRDLHRLLGQERIQALEQRYATGE
jgi:2-methylisocitrate lyase-like PEP mutase family enzyme